MSVSQHVVIVLGDWRAAGRGPLFSRLADAIALAAQRGTLPADGALPAERMLADELGVSRSTVAAAYRELRERGVAETRHGSGTVVRGALPAPGVAPWPALSDLMAETGAGQMVDLSFGVAQLADLAPHLDVSGKDLHRYADWHGYAPLGLPELRSRIAELLSSRGVPTSAEEVLVTSGAQEAIALAVELLAADGRRVAFESPGYPGALDALARVGADRVAVARDAGGIRVDELKHILARRHVHALFAAPGCHHPTGTTTVAHRREQLVSLAREHDFAIIEDTVLDDLRFDGDPGTPLWALAPDRVIAVGSLSKVMWGGLRVGWARAPRHVILRLARLKGRLNLGVGVLDQRAAIDLLAAYDELAPRRRGQAEEHVNEMADALARELPEWPVTVPPGGWSLWIELPAGSAAAFAQVALQHGVMVSAGSACSPDGEFQEHVRVCAGLARPFLVEGARRLAAAWRDFVPTAVPFSTFTRRG